MVAESISPDRISKVVKEGFDRLKNYRAARAMFIKDYVGQYYKYSTGLTSAEPINLIFAALRILIPNIVTKNPVNEITTRLLSQRDYAELLSLSLDALQEDLNLKKLLRGGLVDSAFGMGIFKTSLSESGELYDFGDVKIDNGQIYTSLIDLDDLTIDPLCTRLESAAFIGHRVRVSRQYLLAMDGWNHDLVLNLPKLPFQEKDKIKELTQQENKGLDMYGLQDFVDVIELWVPKADAIVHIPDPHQLKAEEYLKVDDYYGPSSGPYTFVSLTPPVPNNPLPVAPVGLWRDLHSMANNIFHKLMNQADRQKDVILYRPEYADIVQAIVDAKSDTIECIACGDPAGIQKASFGGQNPDNERMLIQLQTWFNYIAGNPYSAENVIKTVGTATQAEILNANATVTVQDMRDIVDDVAAEISAKQAWFLHHDPLIEMPLSKRITGNKEIQLWLTPEQRRGDFMRLVFKIRKRSMATLDPVLRAKRIIEFMTNVVPSAATTAQLCLQVRVPFNLQRYLTKAAEELGIGEWMADIFEDPEFQSKLDMMMQVGIKNSGKASPQAVIQQAGFPMKRDIMTPGQEVNQARQEPAGLAQETRGII